MKPEDEIQVSLSRSIWEAVLAVLEASGQENSDWKVGQAIDEIETTIGLGE